MGALYIHQDAEIYFGNFEKGKKVNYKISNPANGTYIFVINDGSLKLVMKIYLIEMQLEFLTLMILK